jgi:hypothetical protein
MRWFKADPEGGSPALSGPAVLAPKAGTDGAGIDDIRARMLDCMGEADLRRFPYIAHRIRRATDVAALWFLRGDLMAVVASSRGEVAARDMVMAVTQTFGDHLPRGLRPKPGRSGSSRRQ